MQTATDVTACAWSVIFSVRAQLRRCHRKQFHGVVAEQSYIHGVHDTAHAAGQLLLAFLNPDAP